MVERIDTHASIVFLAGARAHTNSSGPCGSTISTSRRPSAATLSVRRKFASIGGRRRPFIVEWSPSFARMTDRMRSGGLAVR